MGTEIDRLGGYSFRSTVTAGDGSNQKRGKMGAGYVNLRKQRRRQQRKVGREEEGSSSNHPELAQTRRFQAKMFPRNGTTGQIEQFLIWQEPRRKGGTVRYEDRKSTWNSGVRKVIRRGSAEEEVRKHRDRVTGAWKQISKQR